MPEKPVVGSDPPAAPDPITSKSFSFPLLLASFLLLLTLAWALYDEMYGLRPWRSYQPRFAKAYARFLEKEILRQREAEKAVLESPAYRKFLEAEQAAAQAAEGRLRELEAESDYLDRRLLALTDTYQVARARVTALAYQWEVAGSPSAKDARRKEVEQATRTPCASLLGSQPCEVRLPTRDAGWETKRYSFDELEQEFNDLKAAKAGLVARRGEAMRAVNDARARRQEYFQERLHGLSEPALRGLLKAATRLEVNIRQIEVAPAGLVDRCQSCHVATDFAIVPANLTLTRAALGVERGHNAPFASHPNLDLLRAHDPGRDPAKAIQRFGCSPCHGGNGRATSSVTKGHGRHKYWLWPLYYRENFEAGCQQCHAADMVTEHAPVLNHGRKLFRERGCIGCHRYEGFDNEGEQLLSTRQQIRQLERQKKDLELEIPGLQRQADDPQTSAEAARALNAQIANIPVRQSALDARIEQLDRRANSLMREEKKVGPSLKEVRLKLRKEWIPYWLERTHEFRPTTKMPQFRLAPEQVQAVAAFIWQAGVPGPAPAKQPPGNAARGKELFETRGCLGCHALGESRGRSFAADLSRVGEKANYDYLVRWIHNPRERTRPYCSFEKRDLGPEDYARHGRPFRFDLENSRCPNDGHELQVQQATVMPSLRLSWEDARDIASFLMTQKRPNHSYAPAPYLDDPQRKEAGRAWVKNYGCAGCHEIATLEEEGRIGTELTTEGSKPIERLDFAMLTEHAKRGILPDGKTRSPRGRWYDVKGFVEHKLARPDTYDDGKYVKQLRMPEPNVSPEEINALTTFLLGSVDPQMPRDYLYRPADTRRDIQEGWWILTKYNCIGCHQVAVGQKTALEDLPQYRGDNKDKLPPPLLSEGARVNPDWLARFLTDPTLGAPDANRNGVRNYLQIRMPTFSFSDNEIRKLVRFFEAMSAQAQPYLPPKLTPLTEAERSIARQLFTHPAAPCLKCHATGVPAHDRNASAPNFLLAPERLRPAWTARWITDPARLAPGTAMPSGLFRREGNRWVFAGPLPAAVRAYPGDHAELLVRYMLQLTAAEQRALAGRSAPAAGAGR